MSCLGRALLPGHALAIGAHLDEPVETDTTQRVARGVQTRDCLYERRAYLKKNIITT